MVTASVARNPGKSQRPQVSGEIEQIASSLEEDIIFGRIGPGARLAEDELIARFGTKRYAVREALRKLEAIGVVAREPNKGARVRSYSREEMEDIYEMREILAREAVRLIRFPVDADVIDKLQNIQDRYVASARAGELLATNHRNNEFHSALYAICRNKQLAGLIDHYAWLTQAFRAATILNDEMRSQASLEHQSMIDALRAGDRDRLETLCIEHMRPAKELFFRSRGWLN